MVLSHQSKTTTRQRQDTDKTNVEPVHSYDAFHTRFVLLWCENTIREPFSKHGGKNSNRTLLVAVYWGLLVEGVRWGIGVRGVPLDSSSRRIIIDRDISI